MRPSRISSVAGLRDSITEAIEAALSRDAERFELATGRLAVQDPQRLAIVQAWVLRLLLEQLHPDGLASADAQDVLRRCLLSVAQWGADPDPTVLALVLTGTLGLSDPDAAGAADPAGFGWHASLLIADLLVVAGSPLAGYLNAAFAELERAETIELP